MTIQLTNKQYLYLKKYLSDDLKDAIRKIEYSNDKTTINVLIDEETADLIRDWAGHRLQQVGFDIRYNLTDEGETLEELIDILFA